MQAPKPINFFYQLELRAKSQFDIDMMELWLEAHVDMRGDCVEAYAYIEEDKQFVLMHFPLDLVEYRILDEEESVNNYNNQLYRRVYSFKVIGLVDFNNFTKVKETDSVNLIGDEEGDIDFATYHLADLLHENN